MAVEHPDGLACAGVPYSSDGIKPSRCDQSTIILPSDGVDLLRVAFLEK